MEIISRKFNKVLDSGREGLAAGASNREIRKGEEAGRGGRRADGAAVRSPRVVGGGGGRRRWSWCGRKRWRG
jgi:hypothetical protein